MSDQQPGTCSMHNEPLIWESGGPESVAMFGRFYCPKCNEDLMRALERDARAVSGEEPYEVLYSVDGDIEDEGEIKFTAHYNLDMLEAAYAEHKRRQPSSLIFDILTEHVGSGTQFCVACPDLIPTRDDQGELPDDRWWIKKHQAAKVAERMDEIICDALAAGDGMYDAQTMSQHLEGFIARMREEHPSPRSVTRDDA